VLRGRQTAESAADYHDPWTRICSIRGTDHGGIVLGADLESEAAFRKSSRRVPDVCTKSAPHS
jgi:hypothetical protein